MQLLGNKSDLFFKSCNIAAKIKNQKEKEEKRQGMSIENPNIERFINVVSDSLPRDIDSLTIKKWLDNKDYLTKTLREALLYTHRAFVFTVSVDYEKKIEDMLKAGKYDFVNPAINSYTFPVPKDKAKIKESVVVELIPFNGIILVEEMKFVINKMGYRPANIFELISFGETYPYVQYQFDIFALGSVWNDRIPVIDGHYLKRNCDLVFTDGIYAEWNSYCRLAIIRKN